MHKDHELHERRRGRNTGVLWVLVAFVVLMFAVTMVKLGPNARNPSTDTTWGQSLVDWFVK